MWSINFFWINGTSAQKAAFTSFRSSASLKKGICSKSRKTECALRPNITAYTTLFVPKQTSLVAGCAQVGDENVLACSGRKGLHFSGRYEHQASEPISFNIKLFFLLFLGVLVKLNISIKSILESWATILPKSSNKATLEQMTVFSILKMSPIWNRYSIISKDKDFRYFRIAHNSTLARAM